MRLVLVLLLISLAFASAVNVNIERMHKALEERQEALQEADSQGSGDVAKWRAADCVNPIVISKLDQSPAKLWHAVKDKVTDSCFIFTVRSYWGSSTTLASMKVGLLVQVRSPQVIMGWLPEVATKIPAGPDWFKDVFFMMKLDNEALKGELAWLGKNYANNDESHIPSFMKLSEWMIDFFKYMAKAGIKKGNLIDFAGAWCRHKSGDTEKIYQEGQASPLKLSVFNFYKYGHSFYTSKYGFFTDLVDFTNNGAKTTYCTNSQAIRDIGKTKLSVLADDFANTATQAGEIWKKVITDDYLKGHPDATLEGFLKDTTAGFPSVKNTEEGCDDAYLFYEFVLRDYEVTSTDKAATDRKAVVDYFFKEDGVADINSPYSRYLTKADANKNRDNWCEVDGKAWDDPFAALGKSIKQGKFVRNRWFDWGQVF